MQWLVLSRSFLQTEISLLSQAVTWMTDGSLFVRKSGGNFNTLCVHLYAWSIIKLRLVQRKRAKGKYCIRTISWKIRVVEILYVAVLLFEKLSPGGLLLVYCRSEDEEIQLEQNSCCCTVYLAAPLWHRRIAWRLLTMLVGSYNASSVTHVQKGLHRLCSLQRWLTAKHILYFAINLQ